jgi:hypothetical protein
VDAKELEALNLLHCNPVAENGGVLGPPFPVVSFVLITLREMLLSWHHTARSLTSSLIGCVIVVSDQAYHCCVIGKLNDGVGVVL